MNPDLPDPADDGQDTTNDQHRSTARWEPKTAADVRELMAATAAVMQAKRAAARMESAAKLLPARANEFLETARQHSNRATKILAEWDMRHDAAASAAAVTISVTSNV